MEFLVLSYLHSFWNKSSFFIKNINIKAQEFFSNIFIYLICEKVTFIFFDGKAFLDIF